MTTTTKLYLKRPHQLPLPQAPRETQEGMEFLLLLLFLIPIFLFFLQYNVKNQRKRLPPGPPALPVIGNLHQFFSPPAPHRHLHHLSNKYGPLMSFKLGSRSALVASSAKMAEEVMKKHDAAFASRPALLSQHKYSYGGFDLAFAPYGEYWRDMRKISVLHLFSSKRVHSFRSVREEEVSRMIEKVSNSKIVNLAEAFTSLSSAIICRIAFGKRFDFEEGGCGRSRFHGLLQEMQAMLVGFFLSDYFPLLGWADTLTGLRGRLEKNFKELDAFYQEVIDEHLAGQEKQPDSAQNEDIMDVLLRLGKDQFSITLDQIKGVTMNILSGGTETSAGTMEWAMTELMKNPKVMERAQEEVRNLVKKREEKSCFTLVNEEEIQKLPYLRSIVKETLRMYPVAPLLVPREAIQKCTVNGYEILPKTLVYVNAWAIGRDPESWESPEEFRPERFMGHDDNGPGEYKLGQDFRFIPFGAGRRGCPGMQLGVATVELGLANLLYSFDWELPEGMGRRKDIDTDVLPGIAMHKRVPLTLVPKRHNP